MHDDMARRIARAELAERLLIRLGWVVVVAGALAITAEVVGMFTGVDDITDGLVTIGGLVLGVILAGAAAFGSGVNIGLNLARLRRELARDDGA